MKKRAYTIVLTIAGTDGTGGAGMQADLKTFAALGCFGTSVITAVVAQNTLGVVRWLKEKEDLEKGRLLVGMRYRSLRSASRSYIETIVLRWLTFIQPSRWASLEKMEI